MTHGKQRFPDRNQLIKSLGDCVDQVFETMVCSFEDSTLRRIDEFENSCTATERIEGLDEAALKELSEKRVVMEITGDAMGFMTLHCTPEGAASIARGLLMMGAEESLDLGEVCDALGECANMLAGSLKCQALDPVGDFQLGTPYFDNGGELSTKGLAYRVSKGIMSLEISFTE